MTDGPPIYLAVDLWMALGGDPGHFQDYYDRNGWGTTWSILLDRARKSSPYYEVCGVIEDGEVEPCVLEKPKRDRIHVHYGASDVGRSEPLPF